MGQEGGCVQSWDDEYDQNTSCDILIELRSYLKMKHIILYDQQCSLKK